MIEIRIEPPGNFGQIVAALSRIPGAINRLSREAVRRTLTASKKDAGRKVQERYVVGSSFVMPSIKTRVNGLSGEMKSSGLRTPLERFKINPKVRVNPAAAGGIYAQILREGGGKISRAFLSNSGGVYERLTAARYPVTRLTSVARPQTLSNAVVSSYIVEKMESRLNKNIMEALAKI